MKRWAMIVGGLAANVVEQEGMPSFPGTWVECGNAGPGWIYDGSAFSDPGVLTWSAALSDPRYFWIDVGPFFDRFGAKALAVTGSTDPQVQGLVTLLLPRKYVDLRRPDLPGLLDLLMGKGIINADDKAAVLRLQTTDYERHIKGLPQPV